MILFEGAMGTYYRWLFPDDCSFMEEVNLSNPERIKNIHKAYLRAGATKLKTNTFSAFPSILERSESSVDEMVKAAWKIANEAIAEEELEEKAQAVADIGPLLAIRSDSICSPEEESARENSYMSLARLFLTLGAKEFLFETQEDLKPLIPAINLIKGANSDAKIIVSFSVNQSGYTSSGMRLRDLLYQAEKEPGILFTGINCHLGPTHLGNIFIEHSYFSKFCYFSPNSGLPERDLGRGRGKNEAKYFADSFQKAWNMGARILGGCCGTNPDDIEALNALFAEQIPHEKTKQRPTIIASEAVLETQKSVSWYERMQAGEKIFAIEYDTPVDANADTYIAKVKELVENGMDLLTIADNPNGKIRMDCSMMAARLKNTLEIDVLPHFTCRDRNLAAIHSLLLGLADSGVRQVLAVTGDPLPLESRNKISPVFNVNSRTLLQYISKLNEELPDPFILVAALNVNAENFAAELRKTSRKVESGAQVFMTQPIYSDKAKDNLSMAKAKLGKEIKILAGVMPLVSHKNALYMKYEMTGIDIPDEVVERYKGLSSEEAGELAVEISEKIMTEVEDLADGFYLMTPFNRTSLTGRLCSSWKSRKPFSNHERHEKRTKNNWI